MIEFVVTDRRTAVTLEICPTEAEAWQFVDMHARMTAQSEDTEDQSLAWTISKADDTPSIVDIACRSKWHSEPLAEYRVTAMMREEPEPPKPVKKKASKRSQ